MAGMENVQGDADAAASGRWAAAMAVGAARGSPGRAEQADAGADGAQIAQRIASVNGILRILDVGLRFRVDEGADVVRIQVVDKSTGEAIRSIPPEYFMKAAAMAASGTKGLILDESV
jgi:uncharacterized FlaG/YvyC family protein